ncbi:KPN_02809 family neutral zinc metallopeptidase [Pseudorhodobacter wandonensis]|uniref:KPN_02809 family neutral zinc metallopeptidase n=1 Tax=Pseudorhodobacter wandonensis TaxID=1120568 RepID=UPI00067C4602|nr:neutral zinc metallopeptidase [Pseudorhodobacter wandonensis]
MKWKGRRESRNIEDRRGRSNTRAVGGIGGFGLVAVLVVGYFLGIDVTPLLQDQGGGQRAPATEMTAADKAAGQFVSVTLADTEDVWAQIFKDQLGRSYTPATLVLFKGATSSPCGGASGASGPFYCPGDNKAYLDTDFFVTLEQQLGAKGDFAAAYVVAHEIAHHVQNELGILSRANEVRAQVSQAESNAISVRIELQADCLAGIWARAAQKKFGSIDRGDLEEAVNAARKIGDDTLQRNAGQYPNPHSFTHGTSEQRSRWFVTGYQSGKLGSCDTFSINQL